MRIPFNRPTLTGSELKNIREAISNWHLSGDGIFSKKCQELLERELGVAKAFITPSCTHALEMTAMLLDVEPGDEVIVPSFTFVSTANAFVLRGAKPIFADIREDTLNIDERQLEDLITSKTKAIVAVHYAGVGCAMDEILHIAESHGIPVVEDNAHGLFARYRGRYLGSMGALATQSFHETKNFTCGEGGALLVNDPQYVERTEILREKGTDRSKFFRGQVDKYSWVDLGSSYVVSEVLSAFLSAQLEHRDEIQKRRRAIWERYDEALGDWARERGVRLPFVPEDRDQSYHMYYMLLPDLATRQALISHLRERDIVSAFHYVPLHTSEMGRHFGGRAGACPVAEEASDRLTRLPFYNDMKEFEQEQVIDAVLEFDGASGR
jgi:dTDP-4-amino-4,6-dideoxygalactose transaminase